MLNGGTPAGDMAPNIRPLPKATRHGGAAMLLLHDRDDTCLNPTVREVVPVPINH